MAETLIVDVPHKVDVTQRELEYLPVYHKGNFLEGASVLHINQETGIGLVSYMGCLLKVGGMKVMPLDTEYVCKEGD